MQAFPGSKFRQRLPMKRVSWETPSPASIQTLLFANGSMLGANVTPAGLRVRLHHTKHEIRSILAQYAKKSWLQHLEPHGQYPLFNVAAPSPEALLPPILSDVLHCDELRVARLGESGIAIGQGLRTGCNAFFYVDAVAASASREALVRLDPFFGSRTLVVPTDVVRPVLRRQAELSELKAGMTPAGGLDLRGDYLPEDANQPAEMALVPSPAVKVIPQPLASFIRTAAVTRYRKKVIVLQRWPPIYATQRLGARSERQGSGTCCLTSQDATCQNY